jgi:hypothetical protein
MVPFAARINSIGLTYIRYVSKAEAGFCDTAISTVRPGSTGRSAIRTLGESIACLVLGLLGGARAEGEIAMDDQPVQKPSDAMASALAIRSLRRGSCPGEVQQHGQRVLQSRRVVRQTRRLCGLERKYGIGWSESEDDAKGKAMQQCGNGHCSSLLRNDTFPARGKGTRQADT